VNIISYKPHLIMAMIILSMHAATLGQIASAAQNSPAPLGKLVDVGGYRVHLYCTGAGSPTVVIVGAGFSFDWGLVQPEVATVNQVCSYDHSGIGWSDTGPNDSCSLRVSEVHNALKNDGIKGPYVLVGHSLGAVVARLYAGRYPGEVAGVVFVDHAFGFVPGPPPSDAKVSPSQPSLAPPAHSVLGGMESDPNFSKLSIHDRELHSWAMSQTRNQMAMQTNVEIAPQCLADADAITKEQPHPLGDRPLVDVSTDMGSSHIGTINAEYAALQTRLLSLSKNSKQIVAENSGHFIMIDRPDVVVDAIRQTVQSVRNGAKF
jgi:pimeloyl-ACP methyl ester carboxylesterase